jgi:hypothetical protein
MVDHLDTAKNMLAIESVYLSQSNSQRDTDVNYGDLHTNEYHRQTFGGVNSIKETEVGNDSIQWWEYRFYYTVGVRLVLSYDDAEEAPIPEMEDQQLVTILATFEAKYRSDTKLSEDETNAFSEQNVGYHVWPYWRELVQSSCNKMDLPPIKVPFYIVK